MIYDSIARASQYRGISAALDSALDLLVSTDFSAPAPGRYEISDDLYYTVTELTVRPYEDTKWEHHRDWIDIQYVLTPGELIGTCPVSLVSDWQSYDEAADVAFSDAELPAPRLPMDARVFAVFFPEDAHRPCIAQNGACPVRRIVIKARACK